MGGDRGGGVWRTGLKTIVAAVVATLLVRWVGVSVLDIPLEFPPLAQAGPTVFFTTISALGAIAVFAVVRRRSRTPVRLFRGIAVGFPGEVSAAFDERLEACPEEEKPFLLAGYGNLLRNRETILGESLIR